MRGSNPHCPRTTPSRNVVCPVRGTVPSASRRGCSITTHGSAAQTAERPDLDPIPWSVQPPRPAARSPERLAVVWEGRRDDPGADDGAVGLLARPPGEETRDDPVVPEPHVPLRALRGRGEPEAAYWRACRQMFKVVSEVSADRRAIQPRHSVST